MGEREWEEYEKTKEIKKELKLSVDAGVREGVKAVGGKWARWKQVWQLLQLREETRVNIIYLCQLPARRSWDCGMEPVTCDCFISDSFNLDSNFYFSVAAFEEWGWLLLLSALHLGTRSSP